MPETENARQPEPGWGRRSLRRRILVWMLWVALLPLVLMAVQGYHCAREAVVESARSRLLGIVSSRKEWVDSWLRERIADMAVISHSRDCVALVRSGGGGAHDRICRYLEVFRERTQAYEAIRLFDNGGEPVAGAGGASITPPPSGDRAADRSEPLGGEPVIHVVKVRTASTRLVLESLLYDENESPVGSVKAEIDLSRTLEPILHDRAGLGKTGRVYLVSEAGELLTRPEPEEREWPARIESDAARAAREGRTDSGIYRDFRDVEVVGGFAWMDGPGWGILAEMDSAEALDWIRVLQQRAWIVGLLAVVLILLLATRVSRLLAAPMRQLSEAARRIAAGGRTERVEITGTVEAEEVGEALNRMLASLDEAHRRRIQSESLAAVGQLSSTIAHEVRNPLSSVKMNLQALGKKVADDPVHAELASIGLDQVRSMETLLQDLLSYAKPMTLGKGPVTAPEILDAAVTVVRAEAREAEVGVETVDETDGRPFHVDADRVRQLLTNLLQNAIHAAGRGGAASCRATLVGDGSRVRFEVTDSGPGIPEGVRDRLFEPFFTTRESGAGLGLAVVKKIVDLHGGTVRAENDNGGGARFVVDLPAKETP